MAAEKQFEEKVKEYLTEKSCYFIKTHGDRFSKVGTPDLIVSCNGYFIGAELKAVNGKPTALQLHHIKEINASGGYGLVLIPSKGIDKVRKYIAKNYPEYIDTPIYDLDGFKGLIECLLS